jgi:beta-xylosidase
MVKAKKRDVIVTPVSGLRDPFVIKAGNFYYMFGTGWTVYRTAGSSLDGRWLRLGVAVEYPEDFVENQWAPEVYEYRGAYYMITTYRSSKTGRRGCAVFLSDHPDGKYTLFSDGHVTPSDWDSIDGTLYIDPEGKPWMVFVHEWTSTDDSVGRMAAARLSDDLKEFITEPVELFRADDPVWSEGQITDGPFIYRCADGQLLMIWSNGDRFGYCVGVARSASGEVTGPWTQDEVPLYSLGHSGLYNGGHGMIFTSFEGDTYVSMHNNNGTTDTTGSKPFFLRIREEGGTLVWDFRDE